MERGVSLAANGLAVWFCKPTTPLQAIDKLSKAYKLYRLLAVRFEHGRCKTDTMKELEKILKDLQKRGYEQVDIGQVLSWMYNIQKENRLKRAERRQNDR